VGSEDAVGVSDLRFRLAAGTIRADIIAAPPWAATKTAPMDWTRIDEREAGGVTVLDVRGHMTVSAESKAASDTIRRLLAEGRTRILVNLAHVAFIDSLGIGDLVRGFTATRRAGGTLKLCGVQHRVRVVLEATQLISVIESFESEEEALDSFHG